MRFSSLAPQPTMPALRPAPDTASETVSGGSVPLQMGGVGEVLAPTEHPQPSSSAISPHPPGTHRVGIIFPGCLIPSGKGGIQSGGYMIASLNFSLRWGKRAQGKQAVEAPRRSLMAIVGS